VTPTQPVQPAQRTAQQDRYRRALLLSIIGVLEFHGQREAAEIVKRGFGDGGKK